MGATIRYLSERMLERAMRATLSRESGRAYEALERS